MNQITLQQISELPAKEKRQLQASVNHFLATQYAAQQRRKRIMTERTKVESEVEK